MTAESYQNEIDSLMQRRDEIERLIRNEPGATDKPISQQARNLRAYGGPNLLGLLSDLRKIDSLLEEKKVALKSSLARQEKTKIAPKSDENIIIQRYIEEYDELPVETIREVLDRELPSVEPEVTFHDSPREIASFEVTDTGMFGVYCAAQRAEAGKAYQLAGEVLARTAETLDEAELARSKAQAKAGLLMGLEAVATRCDHLARQLQIHGRIVPATESVAQIEAVTVAAARAAGQAALSGPKALATVGGTLAKAA